MNGAATMSNGVFQVVPGMNDAGEHVFSVIVKRSYTIGEDGVVRRREADHPLRPVDEYYDEGDAESSTVQHESELAPYKVATDVVVIGKAYAPGGAPTQRMTLGVRVGVLARTLVITGDRFCLFREGASPVVTEPQPFVEMAVRYDRAYGGTDEVSLPDVPFVYPRNGMGRGVVLRNVKEAVDGLAFPNIEDPQDLLDADRLFIGEPDRWHLQPLPAGFGWRQRTWYPRSALLGSYPPFLAAGTVTAEERLGLLPADHVALAKQSRLPPLPALFGNGASLGMMADSLQGGDPVELVGWSPGGSIAFRLPAETPAVGLDIGRGQEEPRAQLHTVSIRPDDRELDLIWRAATVYPGYAWLPRMKRLHAEVG